MFRAIKGNGSLYLVQRAVRVRRHAGPSRERMKRYLGEVSVCEAGSPAAPMPRPDAARLASRRNGAPPGAAGSG